MRPFQPLFRRLLIAVLAPFTIASLVFGQQNGGLERHQYEGTLGESLIGLTIIREDNKIDGGHYFYQKYLKDISLAGSVQGSDITLTEAGGGVFHLHFVGNGSEGKRPLNFENSIGMEGTWTRAAGSRSYPVSLRGTGILPPSDSGRRYGDVTSESDATFEGRVQALWRAVLAGDKAAAVGFISYPLTANLPNGKTKKFRNSVDVVSSWNDLFTPAMIAALRRDLPHDMFVHNGMAMLGNGEAWFDAKGLAVLNVP